MTCIMKTRFIEERAIEIEAFACPIEKPKIAARSAGSWRKPENKRAASK